MAQPQNKLPVVRLKPPGQGEDEWFLKLLGAPPTLAPDAEGKTRYSEPLTATSKSPALPTWV